MAQKEREGVHNQMLRGGTALSIEAAGGSKKVDAVIDEIENGTPLTDLAKQLKLDASPWQKRAKAEVPKDAQADDEGADMNAVAEAMRL